MLKVKTKDGNMRNLIYFRILGYVTTIVMHVVNIAAMSKVLDDVVDVLDNPTVRFFADMQYRYYTCWNFFMQIVYAILALTCDVLIMRNGKGYELPKQLKKSRDCLFSAIVWPCTFVVSSFFWGVYHTDRNLIMPPVLDAALTPASNHVIHTAVVPVVLWELLFQPRYPPKSHWRNISHIVFHHLLYICVMVYTYFEYGRFMYPIFDKAYGTIYFPMLYAGILSGAIAMYYIHWAIAGLLWGKTEKKKIK